MLVSLVLFETEFLNIVSISFTSLILNELIMVALEITTWYARLSLLCLHRRLTFPLLFPIGIRTWSSPRWSRSSFMSLALPSCRNTLVRVSLWLDLRHRRLTRSLARLPDLEFVVSTRFAWKVAVIVAISALPLYVIKLIRSRIAPAVSSKLL